MFLACDRVSFRFNRSYHRGGDGVELDLDPVDPAEEIVVPPAAAVFAVGHDLQTDRLLALDRFADAAVFDRAKLPGVHFTALDLGARFLDLGGPQQAPDLIRPERPPERGA